jgi:hypothetical protein
VASQIQLAQAASQLKVQTTYQPSRSNRGQPLEAPHLALGASVFQLPRNCPDHFSPTMGGRSPKHSANVFVIGYVGSGRTIAHNQTKTSALLSTLIEACASNRRGLAISNEEQSDV